MVLPHPAVSDGRGTPPDGRPGTIRVRPANAPDRGAPRCRDDDENNQRDVLVCDDDPRTRGLVRATLERPGVTVVEAQGVDDLVSSARARTPTC